MARAVTTDVIEKYRIPHTPAAGYFDGIADLFDPLRDSKPSADKL
jgi:hypothetical protein